MEEWKDAYKSALVELDSSEFHKLLGDVGDSIELRKEAKALLDIAVSKFSTGNLDGKGSYIYLRAAELAYEDGQYGRCEYLAASALAAGDDENGIKVRCRALLRSCWNEMWGGDDDPFQGEGDEHG